MSDERALYALALNPWLRPRQRGCRPNRPWAASSCNRNRIANGEVDPAGAADLPEPEALRPSGVGGQGRDGLFVTLEPCAQPVRPRPAPIDLLWQSKGRARSVIEPHRPATRASRGKGIAILHASGIRG